MSDRVFRTLSGDSEDDVKRIGALSATELKEDVLDFLGDPILAETKREHALAARRWAEKHKADGIPDSTRGALGFVKLIFDVEDAASAGRSKPAEGDDTIASLLCSRTVATFLVDFYELGRLAPRRVDLSKASVHAIGTTSVIIDCKLATGEDMPARVALKCLLPRFMAIGTLAETTRDYFEDYDFSESFVARVHASGDAFVVMDFIEGHTLTELLSARIVDDQHVWWPLESERRLRVKDALCRLCERLGSLGRHHRDLSLDNVIARNDDWDDPVLIDFGANNLVRLGFVAGTAAERARSYLNPNAMASGAESDLRALGIMVVELLTRDRSARTGYIEYPVELEAGLETLWEDAPGFAALAERLIYEHGYLGSDGAVDFGGLKRDLEAQFSELDRLDGLRRATRDWWWGLWEFLAPWPECIRQLVRYATAPQSDTPHGRYLAAFAAVSAYLWRLLLLAFVAYGWANLRHGDYGDLILRSAVTSTAFIAAAYYQNILAGVTVRGIRMPRSQLTETVLRTSAVLPIGLQFVSLRYPSLWGLFTAIGGVLIALNNRLMVRLAREADDEAARHARSTGEQARPVLAEGFFRNYGNWAQNLLVYSVGVFIIWAIHEWPTRYTDGWIQDIHVYATVIVIINLARMYPQNCWKDAPRLRASMSRASTYLRSVRAPGRASGAPEATALAQPDPAG
jgi:hypothetical protein